jgi:hypothetical protein
LFLVRNMFFSEGVLACFNLQWPSLILAVA